MALHALRVGPLPAWLDARRLLGPSSAEDVDAGGWELRPIAAGIEARAELDTRAAADLGARLRGVGYDGRAVVCEVEPPLARGVVRRARTEDARRRRGTTPGFERAGARLDDIARMSLTPECLAMRVASLAKGRRVVDAGCGAGGNAIAFARAGCRVVAIEADAKRLALARHNARVYGVGERIEFVGGDAREWVARTPDPGAILFVDPPWGADWDRRGCGLEDLPLLAGLLAHAAGFAQLWAKVPPSFATQELLALRGGTAEAVFGEGEGDRQRVKFVLVRANSGC